MVTCGCEGEAGGARRGPSEGTPEQWGEGYQRNDFPEETGFEWTLKGRVSWWSEDGGADIYLVGLVH